MSKHQSNRERDRRKRKNMVQQQINSHKPPAAEAFKRQSLD